ncbi:MAG: pilus assembly protein [Deltaproteobacteria bacterium]|nr:pilus assembly protein [Deltaproteobacteria bacterium]
MILKIKSHSIDKHLDTGGQAVILLVVTLPLFLILIFETLHFSRVIERKIMLQNGVDASLMTGIEILAQGLNQISNLNRKLIHLHALLLLAQAGKPVSAGASVLTEAILRKMIQAVALRQDFIKKSTPLLALEKAMVIARKNKTPHMVFTPPLFHYAIQRKPPQNGLPSPYEFSPNFSQGLRPQSKDWNTRGFLYRGSYRAKARAYLSGHDLYTSQWKGILSE